MFETADVQSLIGQTVYSESGEKIGQVGQVYLDDQTDRPQWVTVKTGFFGSNESFIPIEQASRSGDGVSVPFDKDRVKGAPNVAADGHISREEEQELYRYYGLDYAAGSNSPVGTQDRDFEPGWQAGDEAVDRSEAGVVGHDTSGPTTDSAMTRSEEQLRVGTEQHEAGRARLRKWVETDTVTQSVPVTRERAVVEREPITEANRAQAMDGPEISEEEHEVVLHEERAVADKTVEPVERVRLGVEQVTEQEQVSAEVRKERVDVEGDTRDR
jgi:uncharacterized protein (TIGR02271 family)